MEERIQYRHEYKFLLNALDVFAVRARLQAVMPRDPHAGPGGEYRIRSLYFDDLNNSALWEKLDGVNERRKFRIRYYNDDLSYIMLECKRTSGQETLWRRRMTGAVFLPALIRPVWMHSALFHVLLASPGIPIYDGTDPQPCRLFPENSSPLRLFPVKKEAARALST